MIANYLFIVECEKDFLHWHICCYNRLAEKKFELRLKETVEIDQLMDNEKTKQGEKAMKKLMAFFNEDDGAGMVEYGLLVALIAIGLIVTLGSVRDGLITLFNKVVTALTTA